jgi:hypothetical protein
MKLINALAKAFKSVPEVGPLLKGKARFLFCAVHADPYKTYEYMLDQVQRLVRSVYSNNLGGDFIDLMANLISGQLTQAYQQAYEDEGFTGFFLPDYLQESLDSMILQQYDFVDGFFHAIVDARIDGTPIEPLLRRAELWAGQWNTAYERAQLLMASRLGKKKKWTEGDTKDKCGTCVSLDGIVAYASEWEALGVHPKGAPNDKLICEGWACQCTLEDTDQRRSPNAYDRILSAISKG